LTGSVQWDNTGVGLNYVTLSLSLASPAANFASKTNALLYFQIEKPVFPAATRLLQAATNTTKPANSTNSTNTTAPVVTGTGDFEGHALLFTGADASYNATAANSSAAPTAFSGNFNMYSRVNCNTVAN
jgi:hypothetical protein